MKLTKGMTMQEVEEMVDAMGWEIFDEQEEEGYASCTVLQGDHAVAVEYDEDMKVDYLEFVPLWAIG